MSEHDGAASSGRREPKYARTCRRRESARLEDQVSQFVSLLGASMKKKEPGDVVADNAGRGGSAAVPGGQGETLQPPSGNGEFFSGATSG